MFRITEHRRVARVFGERHVSVVCGSEPQWSANASLCACRTASECLWLNGTIRIPGGAAWAGTPFSKESTMSAYQRTASSPARSYRWR